MSECKHEFKTVNASYTTVRVCGKCGDLESNIEINEIQSQIKELKSEINKIKEAFIKVNDFSTEQLKKERDELQMQVVVLRGALEEINKVSTEQGLSMLDGACKVDKLACGALDATPVEAAERVQKLVAALDEIQTRCELRKSDDDAHFENYYEAQNALSEWRNIQ